MPVEAKLCAHRAAIVRGARELASGGRDSRDGTDGLNRIASTRSTSAEVLRCRSRDEAQAAQSSEAIELFERKGNIVGAARSASLLGLEVACIDEEGPRAGPSLHRVMTLA